MLNVIYEEDSSASATDSDLDAASMMLDALVVGIKSKKVKG